MELIPSIFLIIQIRHHRVSEVQRRPQPWNEFAMQVPPVEDAEDDKYGDLYVFIRPETRKH